MKKLLLVAAVVAATTFPTTATAARGFTGVVVGKSRGTLAVASPSGAITTVHTGVHARIGARVRVSGRMVRVVGVAHRVRIHAVVVRRVGATIFLAGGRSLFAVHTGRSLNSVVDNQPTTGAVVTTTATVTPSAELDGDEIEVVGQLSSVVVQAVVSAVAPGSITVSVNGQPLTIQLPAGLQLPATLVGQTVTLRLSLTGAQPTAENDDQGEDNGGGDGD